MSERKKTKIMNIDWNVKTSGLTTIDDWQDTMFIVWAKVGVETTYIFN